MATKSSSTFIDNTLTARYGGNTTHLGDISEYKRTRTGVSLPNYKDLIRKGVSATTAFTATSQESLINQPGEIHREYLVWSDPPSTQDWCGYLNGPIASSPSPYHQETARSIAAIKIRQKINSETSAFSGLTFLGELRESIHQIRHPAKAAFKLADKLSIKTSELRRRRMKRQISKREYADAIASSYLEFSFGLLPIVKDITDIASSALSRLEDKRIVRLTGSGIVSTADSVVSENGDFGLAMVNRHQDDEFVYRHRYEVGFQRTVEASNNALRNVIDLGSFEFSEIIPTAWELIPWSFFIDYFSNIGQCLQADLVSLADVVWSVSTATYEHTCLVHSFSLRDTQPHFATTTLTKSPLYANRYKLVNRDDANPGFPSVRFQLPGRTGQFINMAALAALAFPRK